MNTPTHDKNTPRTDAAIGQGGGSSYNAIVMRCERVIECSRQLERELGTINGGSEQGLRQSRDADKAKGTPALAAENEGATSAIASPSSALPTEPPIEALDAMSNGVIFHIVQRAPAPDMGVLRERQRMVWRDVLAALGKVQTPSASRSTEADDKLGMDTRRGGD